MRLTFSILCLALSVAPLGLAIAEEPAAQTPNVVLIISDDHAWTDYGFMGHPAIATPRLDKLASESLTFRRGYVPSSLCCPSLATIITGLYPHQHKVTSNDPPVPAGIPRNKFQASPAFQEGRDVMSRHLEAVPTLPRLLGEQGYLSLQTGKWWQGHFSHGGFTHGMTKGQRHGDEGLDIGRKTMQPIFDFIETAQRQNKPFFVWYAPMLPHDPHTPPERLLEKYRAKTPSLHVAKYWAMVEWFDDTCGQLLDFLDRQKLSENTIVVYLADNGWVQNPDAPGFIRSKRSPYDAGLRTPIMIRWPKQVKPRMSDGLAMSIDLGPTLLTALGRKPSAAMQGLNLLDDRAVQARKAIYGEVFTHNAVDLNDPAKNLMWRWTIDGPWKLIVPHAPQDAVKTELFAILNDPEEKHNIAAANPQVVAALQAKLDAWWDPGPPPAEANSEFQSVTGPAAKPKPKTKAKVKSPSPK